MLRSLSIIFVGIIIPLASKGAIQFKGGYFYSELLFNGEYTTNARANNDAVEDFITTVTPSIAYRIEEATLNWEAIAGVDFVRFYKLDDSNDNIRLQFTASYPNGVEVPYSLTTALSAIESTQSNSEIGEIVRTRDYNASINCSYDVFNLYSIVSGADYSLSKPLSGGNLNEIRSYGLPITVNYRHSEVLEYGIGYRIRKQDSSGGLLGSLSSVDHAFFGSTTGQIFPLVSGSLQLGAQLSQLDNGDSENSELNPYANGNLTWQATELTTCNIGLYSDAQITIGNQFRRSYGFDLDVSHELGINLAGNVSLSFQQSEFSAGANAFDVARDDTNWTFGTGLRTHYGQTTNIAINLMYTQNESSEDFTNFNELSVAFSVASRF